TVVGVVAVVANHEVVPFGYHPFPRRRCLRDLLVTGLVDGIAQLFLIDVNPGQGLQRMASGHCVVGHGAQQLALDRFTVDEQLLVGVTDAVTGQADHPLDVVDARVVGIAEDHDIAALRLAYRNDPGVQHRQADTVGKLVDQDEVANLQGRLHRAGGNLEGFHQEGAQDQHHRQHREEGLAVFDQQRLLVQALQGARIHHRRAGFVGVDGTTARRRQPQEIEQSKKAGDSHGYHQQQRKIDMHSQTCNAPGTLVVYFQHGKEGFLRNLHVAHLFHPLLAGLLLLQQLLLAAGVTAITLGQYVLAQRLDRGARHDLTTHGCLDGNIEHLPRDQILHLLDQLAPLVGGVVAVHDQRQGVDLLVVDQDIQPHQLGRLEAVEGVIQGSIAAADRLQSVEEVEYHLVHRQIVADLHLGSEEDHVALYATLLDTQGYDAAKMVLGHKNIGAHDRLAHLLDHRRVGQARGVVDIDDVAVLLHHLIDHGG